jgi:hypothetical protein
MNWKFFVGASILSCGLLFKLGAPVLPVAGGIAAVALLNWRMHRSG